MVEFDSTYLTISLLRIFGLAWNVAPIPVKAKEQLQRRMLKKAA